GTKPVDLRAERGDHRTTQQGCPLERQRCAMAAFSGLLSLLWSGRAQGSGARGARGCSSPDAYDQQARMLPQPKGGTRGGAWTRRVARNRGQWLGIVASGSESWPVASKANTVQWKMGKMVLTSSDFGS